MLRDITPQQYEQLIDLKGTGLVVIGTESCRICQSMKPVFEEIFEGKQINVVKLDTEKYMDYIKDELFVEAVPAFVVIEEGEVIGMTTGELTVDELRKLVAKIIK